LKIYKNRHLEIKINPKKKDLGYAMMNINKVKVYIMAICALIFLNVNFSFAHGLNYEIERLGNNKERVILKWSNEEEKKGFALVYHYFNNGKTLHIGYELKEGYPTETYLDYDLNSVLYPIRVNLHEVGKNDDTPFSDINGLETEEYIRHLHDAGIINGFPDGTFLPESPISRAEFVVIMVKALGIEGKSSNTKGFVDIDGHWARDYILLAADNGLISGYEDGTVKPDKPITVAEVSSILVRSFSFKTTKNGIYSRVKQDKWYSAAVKKMFDVGILNIKDSIYELFDEESNISRANCAMMISRAISTY